MNWVDLDGGDNVEAGLLKPQAKPSHAGEDVNDGRPGHGVSVSRNPTSRVLRASAFAVSHSHTTQTCQPAASRSLTFLASRVWLVAILLCQ